MGIDGSGAQTSLVCCFALAYDVLLGFPKLQQNLDLCLGK